MAFLIGNIITVVIMIFATFAWGEVSMFINLPSLIVVLVPAVFLSIGATSPHTMKQAIRLLLSHTRENNLENLRNIGSFFRVFGQTSMLMGITGFVIGAIAMSDHFDFGNLVGSNFGPALSVGMITIVYALIIKVFCYIGEQRVNFIIENNLDECS